MAVVAVISVPGILGVGEVGGVWVEGMLSGREGRGGEDEGGDNRKGTKTTASI